MKGYRCLRGFRDGSPIVEVIDTSRPKETREGLLQHHVRHSPDGFAWGYHGSGPAELARCILLDFMDYDPMKHQADELVPPAMYQEFKSDVIAPLAMDDGWALDSDRISVWLHKWNAEHPEVRA
jgi:hypothetical protein